MAEGAHPLLGRHALVTGAARGIGAEIARSLLAAGANVTLLGRRQEALEALAESLAEPVSGSMAEPPAGLLAASPVGSLAASPAESAVRLRRDESGAAAHCVVADVTDAEQVAAAFASAKHRFGPVAILISNAGQAESAAFQKTSLALWNRMIAVNLTGSFLCAQEALPQMLASGWGRIVNIASTAGLRGYAYVAAYTAAKHGVVGLTRALALETARKGITVNAVCPGFTETDILRESIANVVAKTGRSAEEARAQFIANNPQGRIVQPAEVANAVRWLCSDGASSITGQSISVSGGEVA